MYDQSTLFKLRIRYVKHDRLRYLSHLEIARSVERTIRRAFLPYAVTQGFNVRMRVAYSSALPVGVGSDDEFFDLVLTQFIKTDEVLQRLQDNAPKSLMPLSACYVPMHEGALDASLTIACYDAKVTLPEDLLGKVTLEQLRSAADCVENTDILIYPRNNKAKKVHMTGKIPRHPEISFDEDGVIDMKLVTHSDNRGALRPNVYIDAIGYALSKIIEGETCTSEDFSEISVSQDVSLFESMIVMRSFQYIEEEDGTWQRPISH